MIPVLVAVAAGDYAAFMFWSLRRAVPGFEDAAGFTSVSAPAEFTSASS